MSGTYLLCNAIILFKLFKLFKQDLKVDFQAVFTK